LAFSQKRKIKLSHKTVHGMMRSGGGISLQRRPPTP
jgi:hypothetical protein